MQLININLLLTTLDFPSLYKFFHFLSNHRQNKIPWPCQMLIELKVELFRCIYIHYDDFSQKQHQNESCVFRGILLNQLFFLSLLLLLDCILVHLLCLIFVFLFRSRLKVFFLLLLIYQVCLLASLIKEIIINFFLVWFVKKILV